MSFDYTKITHEGLLEDWNNRLLADERFKGLTQASVYQFFQEMIAGISDLSNFYLGRVAEESFMDTARLDSSVIKLSKNLGYMPRRAVPARAEIKVQIHGPLPKQLKAGDTMWLNNTQTKFTFDNHNYLLDYSYSYTFTEEDINLGQEPTWTKEIVFARNSTTGPSEYIKLDSRTSLIARKKLFPIKIFQGTIKTEVIDAAIHADKVGEANQWFDIDDVTFSNYYGKRDPYAYVGGEYSPSYGLCKVGIGTSEAQALAANNVCDIEEYAIELNPKLKKWKTNDDKCRICKIETNPDKTVRIYFGNGNSVIAGFSNTKEKLYVQYVSCDGASANKYGTVDSQLNCSTKIYATGNGSVTNLTNNVKFLFNSDISNGDDFESQASMKISAKLFFAGRGNLLTLNDYTSYFRTLVSPFVVNHAIAFGENQYDGNNTDQPWLMNNVCYTLFGDIYHNYDTGKFAPVNVFDDNEKLNNVMLYTNKGIYTDHLFDMLKLRLYPKTFKEKQYEDTSEFGFNARAIRENCADRMLLNTHLISIPPIFHYYDIVGDVMVDKHKDIAEYQAEIEEKIYSWLNTNISFKSKIYKSDITQKLFENEATKRVNIDLKVSSIEAENEQARIFANTSITWTYDSTHPSQDYINAVGSGGMWLHRNRMKLPKQDIYGGSLGDPATLVGKQIKIEWDSNRNGSDSLYNHTAFSPNQWVTIASCTADDEYMYIKLYGDGPIQYSDSTPTPSQNAYTRIYLNVGSYSSDGNSNAITPEFKKALTSWLNQKVMTIGTTDRPIDLPYIIDAITTNVRTETLQRRGANDITLTGLNENSFNDWLYKYIHKRVNDGAAVESFNQFAGDLTNTYPLLKPAFSDSILDDNNNIVNFSCEQEIPVLRIRLNYAYEV